MSNVGTMFAGAMLIVWCLLGWSEAVAVTLVKDGKAASVIVTAKKPTISANLAARELQYHIVLYESFQYQAASWDKPRRVVAKVEWHKEDGHES